MTTTTIELLRHGQPTDSDCMRGRTDVSLSQTGWEQMQHALDRQQECTAGIDCIITSPLVRCSAFAKHFGQQADKPVNVIEQWQEIDFGDWDGIPYAQLWQQEKERLSQYWADPWSHTPPNGETLVDFDSRVHNAFQQLLRDHAGKHLLVVTHAGVMRQLIQQLLKLPKDDTHLSRIELPYASRIKITVYTDKNQQQWPRLHLAVF
ncbi:histidine phosphatase family protein [Photobacterium lipolyticum]|uniref:phosphoglycerate mutase (2,3-diphosphoglycerate-dependent) n=1 Tax=Photobacterium lipolyticum TaxID=266810 RepID=A0A2T3N101_9GAMM|nr:histidine phosphatase family protein [Photobacterium lipolyticum]PSW05979.1 histidine phosphatase family protein [Photobacterium lipolyticum]